MLFGNIVCKEKRKVFNSNCIRLPVILRVFLFALFHFRQLEYNVVSSIFVGINCHGKNTNNREVQGHKFITNEPIK